MRRPVSTPDEIERRVSRPLVVIRARGAVVAGAVVAGAVVAGAVVAGGVVARVVDGVVVAVVVPVEPPEPPEPVDPPERGAVVDGPAQHETGLGV